MLIKKQLPPNFDAAICYVFSLLIIFFRAIMAPIHYYLIIITVNYRVGTHTVGPKHQKTNIKTTQTCVFRVKVCDFIKSD